jgi:hypothetical protein
LPVRIEDLVGEQTGFDQKLLNLIPESIKDFKFGIEGFVAPME